MAGSECFLFLSITARNIPMHKKVVVDIHSRKKDERIRNVSVPLPETFQAQSTSIFPLFQHRESVPKEKRQVDQTPHSKYTTFLSGTVRWLTQRKLDLQVENQKNITNELEWKSCVGEVVVAQDLESNEPYRLCLRCHEYYVDLLWSTHFPNKCP